MVIFTKIHPFTRFKVLSALWVCFRTPKLQLMEVKRSAAALWMCFRTPKLLLMLLLSGGARTHRRITFDIEQPLVRWGSNPSSDKVAAHVAWCCVAFGYELNENKDVESGVLILKQVLVQQVFMDALDRLSL